MSNELKALPPARDTTHTESTPPNTEYHPRLPSSVRLNPPPLLHFNLLKDDVPQGSLDPLPDHHHSRPSSPHSSRPSSTSAASRDTGQNNGRSSDLSTPPSSSKPQYLNPRTILYPRSQSLSQLGSSQLISDASSSQGPGVMLSYPLSITHSRRSSVGVSTSGILEPQPEHG